MRYRLLSFFLGAGFLIANAAVGDEFTQNGLTYVVKTDNTIGVKSVSSDLTECIIPESVVDNEVPYTVESIEEDAFYWSNVESVTLPNTITTINYGAFRSSPLASINLPSSLVSIGGYAFYNTKLTSVVIPEGVTTIEASTFSQCANLVDVTLPSTLLEIGEGAFFKCGFSSINIPASCTTIGKWAFEDCRSLTRVTLPEGLVEIPVGLFQNCTSLQEVVMPESVTTIKYTAFQSTGLEDIYIPKNVAVIEANAFNDTALRSISLSDENAAFQLIDGVLYTADKRFVYLCPRVGIPQEYNIVDGCVAVWGGAFYGCELKTVTFPDNFIGIDSYSFCYSLLETIELPNSIEVIYEQAFAGTPITSIVIPEGVTELSDAIFGFCTQLTTVTLPSRLTNVGNRAFYSCTALKTINCLGESPAEFEAWETWTDPFYGIDCSQVVVKCPESSLEAYKLSEWGDFFTNIEATIAGVNNSIIKAAEIVAQNGVITIDLFDEIGCNVAVSDISGVVLVNEPNASGVITTTSLPSGVYFVSISKGRSVETQKVLL